ncbi:phage antirepressor KilAC domain-containing protein [Brevibacterium moorei]|uniref:phage antirepressor KilAC domain-containing protein n=1 Tax=Brevibacterium moorei TaxID=2968457 RepID=UPI00211BD4EA|nr:phage antirepressor KilAC domain-containing protein [Brevibacterium sp. 68QC2CO]MCQ9384391.1 phage antirepressor KilAC domain-containing protein [Brevibacterium sp. 68QC2CO]
MTAQLDLFTDTTGSPFDAIRRTRPDGTEYWSARDLMPLLGYGADWRNFAAAISRARMTAQNQGQRPEDLFGDATEKTGGRPREDFHLVRFAAYLVAMNGDPRKPEVAAAQAYFAVKTREAEVTPPARELTEDEIVHQALQISARKVRALEATVEEQRPKVAAWDHIVNSAGSWSYEEAAKVMFDKNICRVGQKRLVQKLVDWNYLYRDSKGRPHARQEYVNQGLFKPKARVYTDQKTGEVRESSAPQVRITGKGLDLIFRRFREEAGQ